MTSMSSAKSVSIPVQANGWILLIVVMINIWQFVILPVFFLPSSIYWALSLIPVVLATTSHWSLIHEAVHSHLFPKKSTNEFAGRILAIFFGSPFRMLRFGHLSHHRISRQEQDRVEVYDPEKSGYLRFLVGYFSYISIGLYVIELVFAVLVMLPRSIFAGLIKTNSGKLWPQAERKLLAPSRLREMRVDGALILLLFALSIYAYGNMWPVLAAALILRGVQISVANASYHYGTPLNETRFANNFSLHPVFAGAILHFNLHHVHHVHPGLPWNKLDAAYQQGNFVCDTNYLNGMLRQFRGPIEAHTLTRRTN